MRRLWIFCAWQTEHRQELVDNCAILNGMDVFNARQAGGTFWRDFPIAQLALTAEEFDLDCFSWNANTFVSKNLRNAMALPKTAAQFERTGLSCK
jgi:hypothetical protein